jgi:hypothetical protein
VAHDFTLGASEDKIDHETGPQGDRYRFQQGQNAFVLVIEAKKERKDHGQAEKEGQNPYQVECVT